MGYKLYKVINENYYRLTCNKCKQHWHGVGCNKWILRKRFNEHKCSKACNAYNNDPIRIPIKNIITTIIKIKKEDNLTIQEMSIIAKINHASMRQVLNKKAKSVSLTVIDNIITNSGRVLWWQTEPELVDIYTNPEYWREYEEVENDYQTTA